MGDDILEYWMSLSRELAARFDLEDFDTSSAFWNWENFGEDIKTIKGKFGIDDKYLDCLGTRVDLETGEALDTLTGDKVSINRLVPHLYYYSKAKDEGAAGEWVKFNALSGSWACRYSFLQIRPHGGPRQCVRCRAGWKRFRVRKLFLHTLNR